MTPTRKFFLLCILLFSALAQSAQAKEDDMASIKSVRLAVVKTPDYSGLLDYILPDFEKESGYTVDVYSGSDVYEKAREGEADIVISHYGKHQIKEFVLEGYGSWPKIIFSNQAVIIGPKSDPAKIRGATSAPEAVAKIYSSGASFVSTPIPGIAYLTNVLWNLAGKPDKDGWFIEGAVAKAGAARLAEEKNSYFIWGASPFLKYQKKSGAKMEIMVSADPLLQRTMSATIVNDKKFSNINSKGANELQEFFLSAETQAKIATFREKGYNSQLWWPAGRNN